MLCINKQRISYDSKFDILSYIWGDTSNAYGDENIDNIVILKDIDSEEVVGYTIMNFKRICENKSEEYYIISQMFNLPEVMHSCGL